MSTALSQSEGRNDTERSTRLPTKQAVPWPPDTTVHSLLHRVAGHKAAAPGLPDRAIIYFASIAITYVPLLLAARLSGHPLWARTEIQLPFLRDWNMAFAFLVSFPTLAVLLVTDDYVLRTSLQRVRDEHILCMAEADASKMAELWKAGFRRINIVAQSLGAGIGLSLGWATLNLYMSHDVPFWISSKGHLLPAGYAYWYCIALLYALITIYVARCIAFYVFLSEAVGDSTIQMLPLHPDKCGGLRPVGQLGLRNQYTLSILGLNVVIFVVSQSRLQVPYLIAASAIAYLILGPIVFMAPLLPFRRGMLRTKERWMSAVAERLRIEFDRLRTQIQTGQITKEDEDLVDRLRKIGAVIDELPVWPFDARTLHNFAGAYIVPLVSLGLSFVGKAILDAIRRWLNMP